MYASLHLEVSCYENPNEWVWGLLDESHARLPGHEVRIDPHDPQGSTFLSPLAYPFQGRRELADEQLNELGDWVRERVFGPLVGALATYAEQGGGPVYVNAPSQSLPLVFRPFELARFGASNRLIAGRAFADAGLYFIWRLGAGESAKSRLPPQRPLHILATLGSAARAGTRDLWGEQREVEQMVHLLLGSGRPVTLRIMHEGQAPDSALKASQTAERWDVVYRAGEWLQEEHAQAAEASAGEWSAPVEAGRWPEPPSQEDLWQTIMLRPHAAPRHELLPHREHTAFLLDQALHRDDAPSALAFAMPLLRQMLQESSGTVGDWVHATLVARSQAAAGEAFATQPVRDLIARSAERGDHLTVSYLLGGVSTQLLDSDPVAALAVAQQMARHTQRAGLGPWRQIADAQYRLRALNALGRYAEVLQEVETLRLRMEALPPPDRAEAGVEPWQVREGVFEVGRQAAMLSAAWPAALDLSGAIAGSRLARGVSALQLARTRFDDYSPLLNLRRSEEARRLLEKCRVTFEEANDRDLVGMADRALAEVAAAVEDFASAVQYQVAALGCAYATGRPEECALSHAALANYLKRLSTDPIAAFSHDLAAAIIWHQLASDGFIASLRVLVDYDWRGQWPRFTEVVATVEKTSSAHLALLFARLPSRGKDGDAALAAVHESVLEARLGERRAKWRRSWLKRKDAG